MISASSVGKKFDFFRLWWAASKYGVLMSGP